MNQIISIHVLSVFATISIVACIIVVSIMLARHRKQLRKERDLEIKTHYQMPNTVTYVSPKALDPRPITPTAQRYFNTYTPEQRAQLISGYTSHPDYQQGIENDPLMFYLFMLSMNGIPASYQQTPPSGSPVEDTYTPGTISNAEVYKTALSADDIAAIHNTPTTEPTTQPDTTSTHDSSPTDSGSVDTGSADTGSSDAGGSSGGE